MKPENPSASGGGKLRTLAQFVGLLLILCGAIGLLLVLLEIWRLYQQPELILTLARALSQATGIDDTLLGASVSKSTEAGPDGTPLLASYFLAWVLAFMLLSLAARVSYLSIKGGSRLFSPESRQKPNARNAVKEVKIEPNLPADYQPSHRRKIS